MPKVTIWIREEDYPNWQTIKDKPEFLHNMLNVSDSYKAFSPQERKAVKGHIAKLPPYVDIQASEGDIDLILATDHQIKLCKVHDTPLDDRGRCMQKGCKYA